MKFTARSPEVAPASLSGGLFLPLPDAQIDAELRRHFDNPARRGIG